MSWQQLPTERKDLARRILTDRQLDVFRHRLNGHSWRTIADAMHINEATVRGHHRAAVIALRDEARKDAA
jgi:DNA-binding NarL/FixJ family response regulator